jgi:hypothetical protein
VGAARRSVVALCTAAAFLHAPPASALGLRYPDLVATASGVRGDVVSDLTSRRTAWSLEAAERDLFGGAGLRVSGVRAAFVRRLWRAAAEAAQMTSGIGRETHVAVRAGPSAAAWSVVFGLSQDAVLLAGVPTAWQTTLAARTGFSPHEGVCVRCDVDGFRVAGVEDGGVDVETSVTVCTRAGVAVASALVVDRTVGAHARVSAALRVLRRSVVVVGYDDENASLSLAFAVVAGGARVVAGASSHPVLGVSRGVSAGWGR